MCWIMGCRPACSSSSQCAPSNTGVAMNVEGGVIGRVLVSVPRTGSVPTISPFYGQPQRGAEPRCRSSPRPPLLRLGVAHLAVVRPAPAGGVAEMRLEHLAHVHPAGYAERVQDDVDGGAVLEEGHVLRRQELGDDGFVPMAAGELVADADLALLRDVDTHELVDTGRELVAAVAAEAAYVDDLA